MILPNEFIKTMKSLLGEEYESYVSSLSKEPKRGFRINNNYIKQRQNNA